MAPNRIPKWVVQSVFNRDYYQCQICYRSYPHDDHGLHCHHVKSYGAGGSNDPSNLVTLCWECHTKVHNGEITLCSR